MLEYSSSPSSLSSPLSPPFPGIISRPFSFAAPLICHAFVCGYFQLPLLLCSVDFHCQSDCFSSQFLSTLFLSAAQHPHIDTHTHTESNCWLGVFFNLSTCWLPTLTKSASLATGRAVRPAGQTQSRKISRVCRQPTAKGLNALVYIATVTSARYKAASACCCLSANIARLRIPPASFGCSSLHCNLASVSTVRHFVWLAEHSAPRTLFSLLQLPFHWRRDC